MANEDFHMSWYSQRTWIFEGSPIYFPSMQSSDELDMLTLRCRETGLDCDYVINGETEEEILKNGADML